MASPPTKKLCGVDEIEQDARRRKSPWSEHETKCLVQLLALCRLEEDEEERHKSEWPSCKNPDFWSSLSIKLKEMAGTPCVREGMSLRSKTGKLRLQYSTIDAAEADLGLSIDAYMSAPMPPASSTPPRPPPPPVAPAGGETDLGKHLLSLFQQFLDRSTREETARLLDSMAHMLLKSNGFFGSEAATVVSSSMQSMSTLSKAGKNPYLVGKFATCINHKRPSSDESLMPLDRMPFGLIAYQVEFFTAGHVSKVKEMPDFRLWRKTMAAELTGSQYRLLRGPGWSGRDPKVYHDPLAARVNVALVSTKTVNLQLAQSSVISSEPIIQQTSIDALVKASIKRVWIKADATDVKVCLQHSSKAEWNGDEDLGDGKLQALRAVYESRLQVYQQASETGDLQQLEQIVLALKQDIVFLRDGLNQALKKYQSMQGKRQIRESAMTEAMWDMAEYNILLQQAESFNQLPANHLLSKSKAEYKQYLADLFKKHRTAATHILLFLASDERRDKKPYSVPLIYIPIRSIRDQFIRDMTAPLKEALLKAGITVVGTVTDGEFCSLRSLGDTRPIHIWQVARDSKLAVSHMSKVQLEKLLFPPITVREDGAMVIEDPHPAVPLPLVIEMFVQRRDHGFTNQQCVHMQRRALVPEGFQTYPFRRNTPESYLDELRTLMATYLCRHTIGEWQLQGVDFKKHLYVPEVDKTTGQVHHERADHCHLLKRIATHTRELRYAPITQEPFVAAMMSPETGLTHVALAGLRRQSVQDAERLLSYRVAEHMEQQGHLIAAEYVSVIAGWHEASDGRGLSEVERSAKNLRMLKYLLDDWIPFHDQVADYSMLDINRPWDNIRGFSRETFVEITTNIESQELRRTFNETCGPEHPRASTTDDCENFFSICHRYLGQNFSLREFKFRWRKIVNEFSKKCDPTLPFYYFTPTGRYREEEEDFNNTINVPEDTEPRRDPRRLHRLTINRREDASVFAPNRVYMPKRYAQTIRRKFHAVPSVQDLPPVPQHLLPSN